MPFKWYQLNLRHYNAGDSFAAAPDLDHANVRVREELTAWLNWLKDDVGFAVRSWGQAQYGYSKNIKITSKQTKKQTGVAEYDADE